MKKLIRTFIAAALVVMFTVNASAQVRINEVGTNSVDFEGASKWVELYNAGTAEVDVSDLILCDFPQYPTVGSLTVLGGGSTTIAAGGYLVVAWPDLDMNDSGDAEIGLYVAGTFDFADAGAVLDYMQYGAAGHTREAAGVGAGVWTAGEFVAAAEAGMSLQFADNGTPGAGNWLVGEPTPNMANSTPTSVEDTEVPADFVLHTNFPNPFNPTTTIAYDLNNTGQVALDVYDMLGQKVASLFEGSQPAGSYAFSWDGRDARGNVVSSGVYIYRLTMNGRLSQSRVMTLLK